jgi:hypothetical protein
MATQGRNRLSEGMAMSMHATGLPLRVAAAWIAAAGVAAALLCACAQAPRDAGTTSATTTTAAERARLDGVITGTLAIYGGSLRTSAEGPLPEAGTVRLLGSTGRRISIEVGKSGKFNERVPAGLYRIIAGLNPPKLWPMGSCRALSSKGRQDGIVIVGKDLTVQVRVGCLAA